MLRSSVREGVSEAERETEGSPVDRYIQVPVESGNVCPRSIMSREEWCVWSLH